MYYALLIDEKTVIYKDSLNLVNEIPVEIKYIIRLDLGRVVNTTQVRDTAYSYSAVNIDGIASPIDLNNFLVIDLGTDKIGRYALERKTLIQEKRTGEIREFPTVGGFDVCLVYTLIGLFNKIKAAGSWEAIDKFEELEEVKRENQTLRDKIRQLELERNMNS